MCFANLPDKGLNKTTLAIELLMLLSVQQLNFDFSSFNTFIHFMGHSVQFIASHKECCFGYKSIKRKSIFWQPNTGPKVFNTGVIAAKKHVQLSTI